MQLGLSGYDEKPRFWRSSANVYYKIHLFFEEFFLLALETYAKKMNQPSIVLGGGGWCRPQGKSCRLKAYYTCLISKSSDQL